MDSTMVIIDKINSMYSMEFTHLQNTLIIIVAFLGFIVPALYYFLQQRLIKIEKREIEAVFDEKFNTLKEELKNENAKVLSTELEKQKMIHQKEFSKLSGGLLHIQGNALAEKNSYYGAISSYIDALVSYIKGEDWINLKIIIGSIKNTLGFFQQAGFDNELNKKIDYLKELIDKQENLHEFVKSELNELLKAFQDIQAINKG